MLRQSVIAGICAWKGECLKTSSGKSTIRMAPGKFRRTGTLCIPETHGGGRGDAGNHRRSAHLFHRRKKQKERGKKNNMEAKGKKKYILTHKRGAGDGCPNDCGYLADPRLSFSAKGILACILAHPEWPELTADWLASQNRDDVSIIEEDLRLMEQAGYIVASKEN